MSKLKPAVNSGDHQLGNANASIILVEFGDFQCPHCRLAHPLIHRLLKELEGKLHFVFRHFPLQEIHQYAYAAALAAEAAGKQGKFWEMHDLIYGHQDKLNTNYLLGVAENLQLNPEQFAKDWKGKEGEIKVENDFESGIRSGVNGTPGFFLNGKKLLTYDETYQSLFAAIQLELEIAGA